MRALGDMRSKRKRGRAAANEEGRTGTIVIILLAVMTVVATLLYGGVDTGSLAILAVMAAVVVLVWSVDAIRNQQFRVATSSLSFPIVAILVIGLIQLLPLAGPHVDTGTLAVDAVRTLSMDPYSTRFFVIRLFVYFIFFIALQTFVNDHKRLRTITVGVIIFGALMAFFGILQFLAKPEAIYGLRPSPQAIPFGPFINQHHFAALMEMTSGLALGLLLGSRGTREIKLLLVLGIALMGISVLLTGSRGGLISLFAVFAFVTAAELARDRGSPGSAAPSYGKLPIAAAVVAIAFVALGAVFYLGGEQSLLRGTGLSNPTEDLTSGRAHFWSVALKIFFENPIFGAGLDAFGVAFTKFDTQNGTFRVEQAHNDYLQILSDAGMLGLACVAVFVYFFFRNSFAVVSNTKDTFRRAAAVGAVGGCLGIMVHSFFDFPLRTPANAFFFLTMATIATRQIGALSPKVHAPRDETVTERSR